MDTTMCKFGDVCERGKDCYRATCDRGYYGPDLEYIEKDPREFKRGKLKCPLFWSNFMCPDKTIKSNPPAKYDNAKGGK